MAELGDLLRLQRSYALVAASPLYGDVLGAVIDDVEAGGVCLDLLVGHAHDPFGSALVLRFLGAVHRLALEGKAPDLAARYPSAGGTSDSEVGAVFVATVAAHADELSERIGDGVQTNEVGRSAVLVGGFLTAARLHLPLRVLEVGASAGLNLRWDHFRYESGDADGWAFGDPGSPVRFVRPWHGVSPTSSLPQQCLVMDRRGCDRTPIDATTVEGAVTLRSFVWPDQVDRLARLDAAIEVARRVPAAVDRADAPSWLAEALIDAEPGVTTVVAHSIMLQYLDPPARQRLITTIEEAGRRAESTAPLVWLRMEPAGEQAELRLTIWPGGHEVLLATSTFHGPPVRWLGR